VSWGIDPGSEDGLRREVGNLKRVVEQRRGIGVGWRCAREGGDEEVREEAKEREEGVRRRWKVLGEGDEDREGGCVGKEDLKS